MGVYADPKSPYWWIRLPRSGAHRVRESTGVLRDAPTQKQRDLNRKLAEEIYATRLADLARDRNDIPRPKSAINFSAFAEWYQAHKIVGHRGNERELEMLERLLAFFGSRWLSDITRDLVTEYLTKRVNGDKKKASTANREVDLLKQMLGAAVPTYLVSSPIAGMERLHVPKIRKKVLSPEEEAAILAQLQPRDQVLFIASIDTLVRLGDVLDLKRADDHGTYLEVIDSKTGPYTVPVSKRLRAGLDSLDEQGEYYFWWRRLAEKDRDRRGAVRMMLQRACKRADVLYGRKVGGVTWHTGTRASGATRMLRRGVDAKTVQTIGNWASLEQMSDYLQTDSDHMKAAVDLIDPSAFSAPALPTRKRKVEKSRRHSKTSPKTMRTRKRPSPKGKRP